MLEKGFFNLSMFIKLNILTVGPLIPGSPGFPCAKYTFGMNSRLIQILCTQIQALYQHTQSLNGQTYWTFDKDCTNIENINYFKGLGLVRFVKYF